MKILVLDDEATIGRAIQRRIRRDHVVHCETDPERAIEWVGAVAGTDARFDVVLCDYNMPKLTGLDVAEALRTLVEPPAFVLMTGLQFLDAVAELVDASWPSHSTVPSSRARSLTSRNAALDAGGAHRR
jgi:CheY-like chemotaxis protein